MAQAVAVAHGGTLGAIEPAAGVGASFEMRVPLSKSGADEPEYVDPLEQA